VAARASSNTAAQQGGERIEPSGELSLEPTESGYAAVFPIGVLGRGRDPHRVGRGIPSGWDNSTDGTLG